MRRTRRILILGGVVFIAGVVSLGTSYLRTRKRAQSVEPQSQVARNLVQTQATHINTAHATTQKSAPQRVFPAGMPKQAYDTDMLSTVGPVIGPSMATAIVRDGELLKPQVPNAKANLALPVKASGSFLLTDVKSKMTLSATLAGSTDAKAEVSDGYVVYRAGHESGADIIHRATDRGTEDFLSFQTAPKSPEVTYHVHLGENVAGVRFFSNIFELLDLKGTPTLRISPIYWTPDGWPRAQL